jgi:hypothetical protein
MKFEGCRANREEKGADKPLKGLKLGRGSRYKELEMSEGIWEKGGRGWR